MSFSSMTSAIFCLYCLLYKIIWKDYIKGSLSISAQLSMKTILVDPNLVRTFFGNILFDPNYGAHPWKELFFDVH